MSVIITRQYLREHPDHIFVFGDNIIKQGYEGAAALRDAPNTYGFITKRFPDNLIDASYTPRSYIWFFPEELLKLGNAIKEHPDKLFLISQLGSGLANRHCIWEKVIKSGIEILRNYPNVIFLWEVDEIK